MPRVEGRNYTVQFLNVWGETVANINKRIFPAHPHGQFAVCLEGAEVKLPAAVQRVDVPVKHMRVLSRVELGADWKQAEALQKNSPSARPASPPYPRYPAR